MLLLLLFLLYRYLSLLVQLLARPKWISFVQLGLLLLDVYFFEVNGVSEYSYILGLSVVDAPVLLFKIRHLVWRTFSLKTVDFVEALVLGLVRDLNQIIALVRALLLVPILLLLFI